MRTAITRGNWIVDLQIIRPLTGNLVFLASTAIFVFRGSWRSSGTAIDSGFAIPVVVNGAQVAR
jgi:uncharacterized membrane protein